MKRILPLIFILLITASGWGADTSGVMPLYPTDFGTGAGEVTEGNDSRLSDARTPTAHASTHTNGTDDIQSATNAQKGLATAAHITAIEANTADSHASGSDAETAATIEDIITGSGAETTPADAWEFPTVVSSVLNKVTWANIKAGLKTYFDTLYQTIIPTGTNPTSTSSTIAIDTDDEAIELNSKIAAQTQKMSMAIAIDPDNLTESIFTVLSVPSWQFPHGITLTHYSAVIDSLATGGSNYRVMLEEWTEAATTTADAYGSDCLAAEFDFGTTNYQVSGTSFSDAAIAAGGKVKADLNNTDWAAEDFNRLEITLGFTVNEGD